jgi:hypothetical protein
LASVLGSFLLLQGDPAARWTFDGEPGAPHSAIQGRAEYRDSAVSGKTLHFNGVDTFVEVRSSGPIDAASFTFSAWIYPSEPATQPIASRSWTLETAAGGALRFGAGGKGVETAPGRIFPGQWHHVAVAVAPGWAELFVNGESVARGAAGESAAAGAPLLLGRSGARLFRGLIDEARWHDRALGGEEIAKLVAGDLPWYRPRPRLRAPFAGSFALEEGDIVAFVGGQNLAADQESAALEALLLLGGGAKDLRVRSLAWEGDMVFEQRRDLNFGPWKRYLERAGASVVLIQFGQMESLRGEAGLAPFREAYGKLLDEMAGRTRRVVVLSPTPFEKAAPPLPDLSARNGDLRRYAEAARALAQERRFLFVDLIAPLEKETGLTRNGVHLTPRGQEAAAREIGRQLGLRETDLESTSARKLREALREKNRLWFDHWRPMNWAFLEGDRTEQPSGREHTDRRIRWFPVEMQDFLPLLRKEEARIETLLQEARR